MHQTKNIPRASDAAVRVVLEKGQKLPHVISDNVYKVIRNQVKISTYLFLKTDPNELLYMTDVPNLVRPGGRSRR